MTTYTAVMPWIYKPYRDAFMETCQLDVFEVDNSDHNIGLMRSHNLGIELMEKDGTDWLVVLSAALRFGPPGGLDFIDHLDRMQGHRVVEAMGVFGWHLIAFHCDTIEAVGGWDENFGPYGFDDIDWSWRYQCVFGSGGQLWDKVSVDVSDAGMAHSIKLANVDAPAAPRLAFYEAKWGGLTGHEHFHRPFNDPDVDVTWWPRPPDPRSILVEGRDSW